METSSEKPRFDLRLAALLIGVILSTVDSSALNLALPSLASHFATDAAAVQGAIATVRGQVRQLDSAFKARVRAIEGILVA